MILEKFTDRVVFFRARRFQIVTYGPFYGAAIFFLLQAFFVLWTAVEGEVPFRLAAIAGLLIPFSVLICSKLLYLLYNLKRLFRDPITVLNETGYAFFGGFLGVAIAIPAVGWAAPGNTRLFLDLFFLCAPIAQIFQRLGCLTYGCCYGHPYEGPFAVSYRNPDAKAHRAIGNAHVHASPLYSVFKNIALLLILWVAFFKMPYAGLSFALWLLLYSVFRFLVDFTRYLQPPYVFGLRFTQIFSVVMFVAGLWFLWRAPLTPYTFTLSLLPSFLKSLWCLPFSTAAFLMYTIGYGYHGPKLGFYAERHVS